MTPLAPRCTHKKSNTAGTGSESQEQQALFAWWALAGPKLCPDRPAPVMYAIPNGGRRDAITGARLKAEGVLAGVPDIFWPSLPTATPACTSSSSGARQGVCHLLKS